MSKGLGGVIALPTISKANRHILSFQIIFGSLCTIFLIVMPLVVLATAAVWALAGLTHLPSFLTVLVAVIVGVPVLWASVAASIMVFDSEIEAVVRGEADLANSQQIEGASDLVE